MSMNAGNIGPHMAASEEARVALTRFASEPTLASQLPVKLKNGFEVEELSTVCPRCEQDICPENTRGTVSTAFAGVLMFDAHGFCQQCMLCVPFCGRVKPYETNFELETIKQGKWVRYNVELPWTLRAWRFMRDQWRKLTAPSD